MRLGNSSQILDVRYARYTPAAPLSSFVACFWYWEGAPGPHVKERLLPNGECSVIFNLRGEAMRIYDVQDLTRYTTQASAILSGARADCFVIDSDQQERVAGIQFRAAGAFPFFRAPASETAGAAVNLEDLWPGVRSGEIRERLLTARTVADLFAELEVCLFRHMVRPSGLHPAVAYAMTQFQKPVCPARVGAVMDQIGLSSRRFIQLFREQVGLPPKVFCRVRRFQHVLQTVHARKDIDWAQIALESGYYDQPHFIHDFHAFSGLTPREYVAAATPHLNHVPLV